MLILRPEPGAADTAKRALEMGIEPVVAPLFKVAACDWRPPEKNFDAIFFTSANAARLGGPDLAAFVRLPCYAVGESTARAAEAAGFAQVRTGPSDGTALLDLMARDGIVTAFHPHGREHLPMERPALRIETRVVYAADAAAALPPEAVAALEEGALALVHSPRAARHFGTLVDTAGLFRQAIAVAAISQAAAEAAGGGWKAVHVAAEPRDHALLELAAKLCKTDRLGIGSDA